MTLSTASEIRSAITAANNLPVTVITFGVGQALAAYLERTCVFGQDTVDENIRPGQPITRGASNTSVRQKDERTQQ